MCARSLLLAKRHPSWIAYCNGIKAAVSRQEYNCTNICKVISASDYLQDASACTRHTGKYVCIYDPKGKNKTIKPCAWTRKDMLSK